MVDNQSVLKTRILQGDFKALRTYRFFPLAKNV